MYTGQKSHLRKRLFSMENKRNRHLNSATPFLLSPDIRCLEESWGTSIHIRQSTNPSKIGGFSWLFSVFWGPLAYRAVFPNPDSLAESSTLNGGLIIRSFKDAWDGTDKVWTVSDDAEVSAMRIVVSVIQPWSWEYEKCVLFMHWGLMCTWY